MPREQAIERIRKAVIKAVPEVMELKFGVRVKYKTQEWFFLKKGSGYMSNRDYLILYDEKGNTSNPHPKYVKILGRPIRLADVLLAMRGKVSNKAFSLHSGGYRDYLWFEDKEISLNFWNLLRDSLTEQSDETILFLVDLLK